MGTIKQSAAGFPSELKGVKLARGEYIAKTVDGVRYIVFNDRQLVCFATNVLPESMPDSVFRVQACRRYSTCTKDFPFVMVNLKKSLHGNDKAIYASNNLITVTMTVFIQSLSKL